LNQNSGLAYFNRAWRTARRASLIAPFLIRPRHQAQCNDAVAYHSRGLAYRDIRDYERSIQGFRPGDQVESRVYLALNDRGIAMPPRVTSNAPFQDFDQAILLDPRDGFAYNNRGWLIETAVRLIAPSRTMIRRLLNGHYVLPITIAATRSMTSATTTGQFRIMIRLSGWIANTPSPTMIAACVFPEAHYDKALAI